jgi:predicted alpha/beta hydrolase family esterase
MSQHPFAAPTIVTVPGLNGSGPTHWQSLWERFRGDTVRAELGMWERPHRNSWVTKLDQTIRSVQAPVVLAAHSLGCIAVAWWAALSGQPYGWPVMGALLVAPADVDRGGRPG